MKAPKIHPVLVDTDKEGFPGWWTYGVMSPTPQSAWDMPPKTKNVEQKKHFCVFKFCRLEPQQTLHRTRFFKKCSYVRLLLIDGGAAKIILGHSTRINKSNELEPHIRTWATKLRWLEDTKLLSPCHAAVRASKSRSQGSRLPELRWGWSYGGITERCALKQWRWGCL